MSVDLLTWEEMREWPEFQAFANRLGISSLENTDHLDIYTESGAIVTVMQRIVGKDFGAQVKTADR